MSMIHNVFYLVQNAILGKNTKYLLKPDIWHHVTLGEKKKKKKIIWFNRNFHLRK